MEQPEDEIPQRRKDDPGALPEDAPWWARWIVANANEAWKWGSMWWPFFCASVVEMYAALPETQQQEVVQYILHLIPEKMRPHALAGVFALSMLLRVLRSTKVKHTQGDPK